MKPLRVLHVVGGMQRAGLETWLMHVTRSISRREFAFDFLLHEPQETAYEPELRELGCRILRVPVSKRSLRYRSALHQCLASGSWDVLHSHEHHTTGTILRAGAGAGMRLRIAHSHNDTRPVDARASMARKAFNRLNRRWLRRHAQAGFAASTHAATALFGEGWREDGRWRVLPCGIDLRPFRQAVDAADLRARTGVPAGARVVGHVGRFECQKNHRFFVEVARVLARRSETFHFLLVGEGSLEGETVAHIERAGLRGRFTLLRNRRDVAALMLGAMDAFLFPSLHEGLGLAVIEAQAAGLPCVMSAAVPPEADIFPAANVRLDLTRCAGEWADAVTAAVERGRSVDNMRRTALLEGSPFSISRSAVALLTAYQELAA
jgi:glycosyltransferase involved in cell wall biosynthesis